MRCPRAWQPQTFNVIWILLHIQVTTIPQSLFAIFFTRIKNEPHSMIQNRLLKNCMLRFCGDSGWSSCAPFQTDFIQSSSTDRFGFFNYPPYPLFFTIHPIKRTNNFSLLRFAVLAQVRLLKWWRCLPHRKCAQTRSCLEMVVGRIWKKALENTMNSLKKTRKEMKRVNEVKEIWRECIHIVLNCRCRSQRRLGSFFLFAVHRVHFEHWCGPPHIYRK